MKIRTIISLAAIGGFLYVHSRRGGELTFASFRQTALQLFGRMKTEASELKDRAGKKVMHEGASTVAQATGPSRSASH